MKKIISLTLILVALVMATSCGYNSQAVLEKMVKDLKLQLPQNTGADVTWTDIELKDGYLVYTYTSGETHETISKTFESPEEKKAEIKYRLANSFNSGTKELTEALVNTNQGIIFRYKGLSTSQEAELKLSPEEVKNTPWNDTETLAKEYITLVIKNLNEQAPMTLDEVTILSSVIFSDGLVSYNYSLLEDSELTISALNENRDAMIEALLPDLNDSEIMEFESMLKAAKCNLRYKYNGNVTGQTFSFTLEPISHRILD